MKLNVTLFITALLCSPLSSADVAKEISAVEHGLRGENHFQGEKTWSIESRMKHYGVPGVSVAVIKDFKIHWVKHYGVSDKSTQQAVSDQTLFQAGSISKPVAAYGALKLVEQKKLTLDEPVNNKLKGWKIPDNELTKKQAVTLKQLLSHSAGLTVHGFGGYPPHVPVPTTVQVLNGEPPANSAPVIVDLLPGSQTRYSGGGYTVAQKLVTDLTGQAYPKIMNDLVLSPLNMKHSTYEQPLPAKKLKWAAAGYLPNKEPVPGKRHTYPEMAAAGLWTTARDLALFVLDIQKTIQSDGGKVLQKSTVNTMLTPVVNPNAGLGIFIENKDGEVYFGHGGWDEGFSADMVAHKSKGYGVVIMTNSNHPAFIEELKFAVAAAYQWDHFVSPSLKSLPISRQEIKRVVGRYQFDSDMVFSIYEEGQKLYMQYLNGEPMEVLRIGDNQFVRREIGAKFRFQKTEEHGPVNLVFGINGETEHIRLRLKEGQYVPFEWVIKGELEKAEKAYLELFKSDPLQIPHIEHNLLTFANQQKNKVEPQKLQSILTLCNRLFPFSYHSKSALAEFFKENGQKDAAIKSYEKLLLLNPNDEQATLALKALKETN